MTGKIVSIFPLGAFDTNKTKSIIFRIPYLIYSVSNAHLILDNLYIKLLSLGSWTVLDEQTSRRWVIIEGLHSGVSYEVVVVARSGNTPDSFETYSPAIIVSAECLQRSIMPSLYKVLIIRRPYRRQLLYKFCQLDSKRGYIIANERNL